MKKRTSSKKRGADKSNKKKDRNNNNGKPLSWVDEHLDWISVDGVNDSDDNEEDNPEQNDNDSDVDAPPKADDDDTVSIISWNVLADSYCRRNSHKRLPMKYQRHVFDRPQRQHHIRQILRKFGNELQVDLLALQEVDPPLEIQSCMNELGYLGVETPTCPAGKDGRVDSCCLYYQRKNWTCLDQKIIRLDDLATLCSKKTQQQTSTESSIKEGMTTTPPSSTNSASPTSSSSSSSWMSRTSNLQGVQSTFVRKNMALLVKLENKHTKRKIVVAVMHLYWNPNYDYVKLCQAHYIAETAKQFATKGDDNDDDEGASIPIVVCGDFNSKPGGHVHKYFVNGYINAKSAAPWYNRARRISFDSDDDDDDSEEETKKQQADCDDPDIEDVASSLGDVDISTSEDTPKVRYMLDYTLNRFCRWLRILGLDSTLETEEEERLRTTGGKIAIFDHCKHQKRTLVTTSTKLLRRKDCPAGAYLLDTKSLKNVEVTLVHMLLSHGVILDPSTFLTRCVVCNGKINQVFNKDRIRDIFSLHKAPEEVNEEVMDVFQCDQCQQGYWWCDKPTSSASRVKCQATNLLEMCIRGGVPTLDTMGMFGFVDVQNVKQTCPDDAEERFLLDQRLDVLEWLQLERLENPCGPFRNVYSTKYGEETLPFTNVTSDFVGHLDYIMHKTDRLKVEDRLFVPISYSILAGGEENFDGEKIRNRHLLPSDVWPSDHLAVGGRFSFIDNKEVVKTETGSSAQKGSMKESSSRLENDKPSKEASDVSFCAPIQTDATPPAITATRAEEVPLFCAPLGTGAPPPPPPVVQPSEPSNHGQRCDCGCVPNVLSLFEMAELRKRHREQKQQEQAQST